MLPKFNADSRVVSFLFEQGVIARQKKDGSSTGRTQPSLVASAGGGVPTKHEFFCSSNSYCATTSSAYYHVKASNSTLFSGNDA